MTDSAASALAQAQALLKAGDVAGAHEALAQLVAREPGFAEAWYRKAQCEQLLGRRDDALQSYAQARSLAPHDPRIRVAHALALVDHDLVAEAEKELREAVLLAPNFGAAHHYLGTVLQRKGDADGALACYRRAAALTPAFAAAHNNLAVLLAARGESDAAITAWRRAVQAEPRYAMAWRNLADHYESLGRADLAAPCLRRVLEIDPHNRVALSRLAHMLVTLDVDQEAEALLTRLAELEPSGTNTWIQLGRIYAMRGQHEAAITAFRRALDIEPSSLGAALGEALTLPVIFESGDEIRLTRERYALGIDSLRDRVALFRDVDRASVLRDLQAGVFYLAYQGQDDLALQTKYGDFVHRLLTEVAPDLTQPLARRAVSGRRLRVGFASHFFRNSVAGLYFQRWITGLDRSRFEIELFYTAPVRDALTETLARASDRFHTLAGDDVAAIGRLIRGAELDVLVFPEIGMGPVEPVLGAMRLAPVQVMGWGHPVTSGLPNVDVFLSAGVMEPAGAQAFYRERLMTLPGIGTSYSKPVVPKAATRAQFDLPDDRTLYLCPQALFKIHPDNDALLVGIAQRDTRALIVLFSAKYAHQTRILHDRLRRAFAQAGLDADRFLKILPRMKHSDFLGVNTVCDVMLDTLHWSGGNTSLDAIAAQLPIVTSPGRFMRGRQSFGMLTLMNLVELVASDANDYVDKAIRLAHDRDENARVRELLGERSALIFDRHEPIDAFADTLARLCETS